MGGFGSEKGYLPTPELSEATRKRAGESLEQKNYLKDLEGRAASQGAGNTHKMCVHPGLSPLFGRFWVRERLPGILWQTQA